MNTAQDFPFSLIQSLTSVEKRAFKQHCQQHIKKGGSIHLDLFEAILRQNQPDDTSLVTSFPHTNLPAAKNRLYFALLRTLSRHHTASDTAATHQQLLHAVRILRDKKLYPQALKLLRSLEKKARRTDQHVQLLELSHLRMQLFNLHRSPHLLQDMQEVHHQHRKWAAIVHQEEALHATLELLQTLTDKRRRQKQGEMDISQIEQAPELAEKPLSFIAAKLQTQIRAVIAISKGQFETALEAYAHSNSPWHARPELIPHHSELYMRHQLNHLNACLVSKDPIRFQSVLQATKAQFHQLTGDLSRHQRRFFYIELVFCLNFGNEAQGAALLKDITAWLDGSASDIEDYDLLPFLHNCAIFHFLHSNFRSALPFLNRIRNIPKTPRQEGIQLFAPILEIILHYELGNHDYIESRLRALTRNPRKLSPYHKRIAKFFKGILRLASPAELVAGIGELQGELDVLAGKQPPTGHFEIRFWLESRLRRVPVKRIYEEALAGR